MTVEQFIQEQNLRNRRPNTIKNDAVILGNIDKFKHIDSCTADDLRNYIIQYKQQFKEKYGKEPQESSINVLYAVMKKYFTFMKKPEAVDWIKTRKIVKKLNPNKLLTAAEVQNMIRVWDNARDVCMLALGYESGMRIGELLSLKVEDVIINDGEYHIRIPDNHESMDNECKTGSRPLILIESAPYIERYLNFHEGGDRLFNIKRTRADEILKEMAAKAGIKKRVYWHLLRHTRATELAKLGMQETSMKRRFGWTEDSSQIKRYTSLSNEDVDDAYRNALGLGTKKKDMAINPIARRCVKCGKLIDTGDYCQQCSEIQKLSEYNTKAILENQNLKAKITELEERVAETAEIEDTMNEFAGQNVEMDEEIVRLRTLMKTLMDRLPPEVVKDIKV